MLPHVQESSAVPSTSSARNIEESYVVTVDNIKQEQFSDNEDNEEWCKAAVLAMDTSDDDDETIFFNGNGVPQGTNNGAEAMETSRVPPVTTAAILPSRTRQGDNSAGPVPIDNDRSSSTGRRQPVNRRKRSEPASTPKNTVARSAKRGKFTAPNQLKERDRITHYFTVGSVRQQQQQQQKRPTRATTTARTRSETPISLPTNNRQRTSQKNSDRLQSPRNVRRQRLSFSVTLEEEEDEEDDENSESSSTNSSESRIEGQQVSIQEMSILRIRLESLEPQQWDNDTSDDSSMSIEERAIEEIMKRFEKTQHKNKEQFGREPYERQKQMEIILSREETQFLGNRPKFQAILYVQQTVSNDNLLRLYDSDKRSTNIHMIWFFHRPNELYALTTNQAWNVVHQFADFNFPGQIAARICSEDGPKETKDKVLVGYVLQDSKLRKGGQGQNPHDSPVLCTYYTAELRDCASILKFPCFKDERNNLKKTRVKFGFGLLRFRRSFYPTDLILILDHLSVIQRREDTFKCLAENNDHDVSQNVSLDEIQLGDHNSNDDNNVRNQNSSLPTLRIPQSIASSSVSSSASSSSFSISLSQSSSVSSMDSDVSLKEKDTEIYTKNLTRVKNEIRLKLDNALAKLFRNEIDLNLRNRNQNQVSTFNAFHLSYKHDDFHSARSFKLMYKTRNGQLHDIKQLVMSSSSSSSARPTLRDIVNAIVRDTSDFLNPVKRYDTGKCDIEKYKEELKRLKIQYTNDKGQNKSNDLFSFTEGEMFISGDLYWRVNNLWCTVSSEYAVNVDFCWYLPFLKKNYESPQTLNLNVKWPSPRRQQQPRRQNELCPKDHFVNQFENSDTNKFFKPPKGSPFLFDLAQLVVSTPQQPQQKQQDSQKIYFHFISTNFRCDTMDLCERMNRCLQEILKMYKLTTKQPNKMLDKSKNPKNIKGFSGAFKKFYNENFKDSLTVLDFIKILQNFTMVYILPHCVQAEVINSGPMDVFVERAHNNQNNQQQQPTRGPSLEDERRIPEKITPEALEKFLWLDYQNKDNKDRLTFGMMRQLSSRGIEDDATESEEEEDEHDENVRLAVIKNCAKLIYEQLERDNYVSQNIVTADLLYSSVDRFKCRLVDKLNSTTAMLDRRKQDLIKEKIYLLVSKFVSKFRSLRAKLELRELDNEIKKFPGIQLKICEIQQEEEDDDDDDKSQT